MPARKVCQTFFRHALASTHQYRQNAIIDSTVALMNGATLSLTSIGRHLPGTARVKDKIKRIDRLLGNTSLHRDIPLIFNNIVSMMTKPMSWCVIAVDWSGYPCKEYHVLRASLICDGRAIPLMSQVVPLKKQNNVLIQNTFLDALAEAVAPNTRVTVITDAGFQSAWFRHIKFLGWSFIGRIRGTVKFSLHHDKENWMTVKDCEGTAQAKYLGAGTLARAKYAQCDGHFFLHKKASKGRKSKRARGKPGYPTVEKEQRASAKEPWLIFTSTDEFKPREIMKLYSRRMQIEQNFRDEKSERFGFGLRASGSKSGERLWVLSLLATLASIVLWLLGYHFENKGLHLHYQANSVKKRRVISFLTLAENVLRHSERILRRVKLESILVQLASTYRSMVLVY
ncbi:IS4 family transposase [Pectobacterium sp. A5351]|uniref:IS4 family transposase n=1 Tax=Pectobacterium sp. A5351 TaxID=2914983 RepID=UPI00232D6D47|nr:IS4 family transposase [Pectobacterium sp. A5351]WCG83322.1 IS4 family transposase [Pectobacterium sp. A5351]WCG83503.1 IS4 family transposase [Pectobacterium sp. A5351]WCG84969.1 IS4 family transposase [Pectobacterium sp. A5351]